MPLEFEENTPQESRPAALQTEREALTENESRFASGWKRMRDSERLERFRSLPPRISPDTREALFAIVLSPPPLLPFSSGDARELRREVAGFLLRDVTPEVMKRLAPLLLDADLEVQQKAYEMYFSAGREAVPFLIEALNGGLINANPFKKTNREGFLKFFRLFGAAKDPKSTQIICQMLIEPLKGRAGATEQVLKWTAILMGGGITTLMALLDSHGYAPNDVLEMAFALGFPLVIEVALLYVYLRVLFYPYIAGRNKKITRQIQTEALSALRSIGDKSALPLLMAHWRNDFFFDTTAHLLPLLEKRDRERLFYDWQGWNSWCTHYLRAASEYKLLVVLRAVQILGTESHLPAVRRLSQRGRSLAVREEASRALTILEAMFDPLRAKRELLRASSAPDNAGELLRPSYHVSDPQEERELLHPSDKPEE